MSTPNTPTTADIVSALPSSNGLRWRRFTYAAGDRPGNGSVVEADSEVLAPVLADMLADPALAPLVYHDPDTGEPVSYDMSSVIGLLGKAVAELSTEVAELRRQVEKKPSTSLFPWEPGWFLGRR